MSNKAKLPRPLLWLWALIKDSRSSWINCLLTLIAIIIASSAYCLAVSTYNKLNRPRIQFGEWRIESVANDFFFVINVSNNGNEDTMDIRLQFVGIDPTTKRKTILKPETLSLWPRLISGDHDEVRLKMNTAESPYMLGCVRYSSDRGKSFPAEDTFFALSSLQAGMRSVSPPSPNRSEKDQLAKISSCLNL